MWRSAIAMSMAGSILLALAGCSAPARPAPPPPGTNDPAPAGAGSGMQPGSWFAPRRVDSIANLIPLHRVPTVTARAVGLVFVTGRQVWGGTIDHERGIDLHPRREVYALSVARSSPYPMYWEATGGGEHFMKSWDVCVPGGGTARYDATAYNHRSRNPYGLRRRAHIVELEVNGGRGGCPNNYFVATAAKILDGTSEVPLDPEASILELRRRFDELVAGHADQLKLATEADREPVARVGVLPTWLPATRELEVLFVYRKLAGTRGVAMAARYTVDRAGRFLHEQVFLPVAVTASSNDKFSEVR